MSTYRQSLLRHLVRNNAVLRGFHQFMDAGRVLREVRDLLLTHRTHFQAAHHPNPLTKFGTKCFSQTDEDGLTLEILRRLGLEYGVFAEFGVGNGKENSLS